jgi:hypothetical protein
MDSETIVKLLAEYTKTEKTQVLREIERVSKVNADDILGYIRLCNNFMIRGMDKGSIVKCADMIIENDQEYLYKELNK